MQRTIKRFLTNETLTFGAESVVVEQVDIAWDKNPPVIRVVVRVADPNRPTFKQVSKVQEEINRRQAIRFIGGSTHRSDCGGSRRETQRKQP